MSFPMTSQNQRTVYGQTLVELGKQDENIVVCDADLSKSTMTCFFQEAFPRRFFEMGIAEQNMTSFAAGLSLTGKTVFINSFAVFSTGRNYDQLRQSICIGRLNVKVIGSSSGLSDFSDGATHQAVEDLALMRALPNMRVLVPADGNETRRIIQYVAANPGPFYIRINRNDVPDILPLDREFSVGKTTMVRKGRDVVVFACGIMVSRALEAAEVLDREGISVRVVNVSTLKPIDGGRILTLVDDVRGVVTAEEHSLIGGLADAVTFALRGVGKPLEAVGIPDRFGQSALNYDELLRAYGLDEESLVSAVRKVLEQVR